jgi:probable HAF family extracellular repeat protein
MYSCRFAAISAVMGAALLSQSPVVLRSQSVTPTYTVTDLATTGPESYATDIDDSGLIVGYYRTTSGAIHAFSYRDGVMSDLGTLGGVHSRAYSIAVNGDIAGEAQDESGNYQAVVYRSGSIIRLGSLGGSTNVANDVNGSGEVVGNAAITANAATRAFLYRAGTMTMIPATLGGTTSTATAINESGEIVGSATTSGVLGRHAYRYSNGIMTDLGTLGGTTSEAKDVDNAGQVVGHSWLAGDTVQHPFLHTGGRMVDIVGLGGTRGAATRINQYGEIVGWSRVAGGAAQYAFLWRNGVITDLNSAIPADSGWTLVSASGIDSAGQIVGVGVKNGLTRAFLLTPPQDLHISPGNGTDSNLPRPVQTGRTVAYTMSVWNNEREGRESPVQTVTVTDTVTGPVAIVSAEVLNGGPCVITGQTATCSIPGVGRGTTQGAVIIVRPTAAGVFSHIARIAGPAAELDPEDNFLSEENTAISLASLTLTPSSLAGGKASSARMTLTSPHTAGATVRLTSSNATVVPVPATFVVTDLSRSLNLFPKVVSTPTAVTISATYGLVTKATTMTVLPPVLSAFSLSPTTVIGGCGSGSAKFSLTGWAPSTGAGVSVTESIAAAQFPSAILIPAGASTKSLSVGTAYVTSPQSGLVTAAYGGISKSVTMTVRPIRARSLTLASNSIVGGSTVAGTVSLECAAAPGPIVVALSTSNSALATPTTGTVTIPAGSTSGSFAIRTARVSVSTSVSIRATVYGIVKVATLTLTP